MKIKFLYAYVFLLLSHSILKRQILPILTSSDYRNIKNKKIDTIKIVICMTNYNQHNEIINDKEYAIERFD